MIKDLSPIKPDDEGKPVNLEGRPVKPPPSDRFRKMEKKHPGKKEEFSEVEKKDKKASLFDLSRTKKEGKSHSSIREKKNGTSSFPKVDRSKEKEDEESTDLENTGKLFATDDPELLKHLSAEVTDLQEPTIEKKIPSDTFKSKKSEGGFLKKDKDQKSSTSSVSSEHGKSAGMIVNPPQVAVSFQGSTVHESPKTSSSTIREIATQIIDRIQIMKKEGETSTMITLRHPPLLAGSTITLHATDHAKNEFNISFANLSHQGKIFLDRMLKEDPLNLALERKGIIVHHLVTTTQPETLITQETGQTPQDQRDKQQQGQKQQDQRSFQDEDEEG